MGRPEVGPDDHNCKRCGQPVRYARPPGRRPSSTSFDAAPVPGGGYQLVEIEDDIPGQGRTPTGEWQAVYIKVADRDPGQLGYRQHNCPGYPDEETGPQARERAGGA
jgi:hypothetical protein